MSILPYKYRDNISPEVAAELDKIAGEMVVKVEPEMQRIALILETHSIPCKILNLNYENNCFNVLGIPFGRNHKAAFKIGKIMEAARKRDRETGQGIAGS